MTFPEETVIFLIIENMLIFFTFVPLMLNLGLGTWQVLNKGILKRYLIGWMNGWMAMEEILQDREI